MVVPPDSCRATARPGDTVCVTPQVATEVAQENANAANARQPGGGAYGPLTCKPGLVWREAFVGDAVCVTPDRRTESKTETAAQCPSNGAPGGPGPRPVARVAATERRPRRPKTGGAWPGPPPPTRGPAAQDRRLVSRQAKSPGAART